MTKGRIIAAVLAFLVILYAALTVTVVKEGQEATLTGEVAFDPTTVATNFWKEKSADYFEKSAVDLVALLTEANGDLASVAGKYGHYSMGDQGELSFIVKGSGTITSVKNKLRSGYFVIEVDGNTSDVKTRLQIGPVFKGSAVRDSISLISYKDYKNQIEWAQVSVAFHDLICKEIINNLDMTTLEGKQVDFIGCFTVNRADLLQITPVKLTVK
ncbi:MAG: DUF2291 domain-containing protein [Succinivibrio sp.]